MEKLFKLNYYFLLLILGTFIFPSISGLPLTPAAAFYVPFWLILLFFTCPQIFISKGFFIAYFFLILHLIYSLIPLYSINKDNTRFLSDEVLPLMFSFSVLEYYQKVKRYNELKNIGTLIFYGTIITAITSTVSLFFFPSAARDLAGGLSETGNEELASFYNLIGIGGFYFYIYLAIISSIFFFLILSIKKKGKIKTRLLIVYIILLIAVVLAQYAASLALFVIGALISGLNYYRKKTFTVILILISSILIYINKSLLASYIVDFANFLNFENLTPRIINIAAEIEGKTMLLTDEEAIYKDSYDELRNISMNSFAENIWVGGGKIGDHTFWYDVLGNYGLIGLLPWLFVFYYLISSRISMFEKRFKSLFLVCIVLLIYIGFHKPIRSFEAMPYFSILLPLVIFKLQEIMNNYKI